MAGILLLQCRRANSFEKRNDHLQLEIRSRLRITNVGDYDIDVVKRNRLIPSTFYMPSKEE